MIEQATDVVTKALGHRQFQYLLGKLGISNLDMPTWRGVLAILLCYDFVSNLDYM